LNYLSLFRLPLVSLFLLSQFAAQNAAAFKFDFIKC
jgi:hypothetical protein